MPRAGLAKENLSKGPSNFGTGNGEITNAVVIMHQFPANKTTGDQEELRPKVRITLQRMDKDWKPTADDPSDEYIAIAGKGGAGKFHPGNAQGSDDEDPEDLGDTEGVEGNCIYAVEGASISDRSKIGKFTVSLEECGFKASLLNGYMPNLIGTQAHFVTKKEKNDIEGGKDYDVLLVDQIQRLPYQKGGAKPTVKATAPGAAAGAHKMTGTPATSGTSGTTTKPATKVNGAPVTGSAGLDPAEVEARANLVLAKMGERKAGQAMTRSVSEGLAAQRIPGQVTVVLGLPEIRAQVPVMYDKAVRELIASDDYFLPAAESMGWVVDGMSVTVPA